MALTKVTGQVIKNTTDVTVGVLTVTNTLTIGGTVSIGGTLTYEDVTNVDAVGLITARNGIVVGSGITLSKDGDIFATGITTVSGNVKVGTGITLSPDGDVFFTGIGTGNGSGLTALNASNLASGTVPTARLGSGTASSSTFLRGDSTFQTVSTDLVDDTTPQLGGNLDVNTKNIIFGDSGGATDDRLTFGAGTDLSIYHDGSHTWMKNATGRLILQTDGDQLQLRGDTVKFFDGDAGETLLQATLNGAVDLYYDNVKTFSTISNGILIEGTEGAAGILQLYADEGDDNGDKWRFVAETNGILNLQDYGSGSWYNNIRFTGHTGGVILFQDNDAKFQTQSDGVRVEDGGKLYLQNDSENAASYIYNAESSGESNFIFNTYDGSSSADRWEITKDGHFIPQANDSYDIGASSYRVRNIYTGDLHCSNEGSKNDVDGTWGDYTIQEGESDLFLINNRSGKKYKFNLTEVS